MKSIISLVLFFLLGVASFNLNAQNADINRPNLGLRSDTITVHIDEYLYAKFIFNQVDSNVYQTDNAYSLTGKAYNSAYSQFVTNAAIFLKNNPEKVNKFINQTVDGKSGYHFIFDVAHVGDSTYIEGDNECDECYDYVRASSGKFIMAQKRYSDPNSVVLLEKYSFEPFLLSFSWGKLNLFDNQGALISDSRPYALNSWRSNYFSVYGFYQHKIFTSAISIRAGLGLAWYNFSFNSRKTPQSLNNQTVWLTYDFDGKSGVEKSKLTLSTIQVPIMFDFKIPINPLNLNAFVGLGGNVGYVFQSYSKTKSNQGHIVKGFNDFNVNPFMYGLRSELGLSDGDSDLSFVSLFFDYQLSQVFKSGQGPIVHPFTFGVILNMPSISFSKTKKY